MAEVPSRRVEAKAAELPVTTVRPSRGWIPLELGDLWAYRELLGFLAWRDVKVRYKQTVLGAAWAILQAVGDAQFQKKCLGKMGDVAKEGRTVIFVSHNMGAVGRLCGGRLVLDQGKLVHMGSATEAIDHYAQELGSQDAEVMYAPEAEKVMQIRAARLLGHAEQPTLELDRQHPLRFQIDFEVRERVVAAHVAFMIDKADGTPICHSTDIDALGEVIDRSPGLYRARVEFPGGLLNAGTYQIRVGLARYGGTIYDYHELCIFQLIDSGSFAAFGAGGGRRAGVRAVPMRWETRRLGPVGASSG